MVWGVLFFVEREGVYGGGVDVGDGGEVELCVGVVDGVDYGVRV